MLSLLSLHLLTLLLVCSFCAQLNLWGNNIGAEGAKSLADALRVNGSLTSINLKDNRLGDVGWCAIFDALRDNPQNKIKEWTLERQGINSIVAKSLAAYVAVSGSLTSVR